MDKRKSRFTYIIDMSVGGRKQTMEYINSVARVISLLGYSIVSYTGINFGICPIIKNIIIIYEAPFMSEPLSTERVEAYVKELEEKDSITTKEDVHAKKPRYLYCVEDTYDQLSEHQNHINSAVKMIEDNNGYVINMFPQTFAIVPIYIQMYIVYEMNVGEKPIKNIVIHDMKKKK